MGPFGYRGNGVASVAADLLAAQRELAATHRELARAKAALQLVGRKPLARPPPLAPPLYLRGDTWGPLEDSCENGYQLEYIGQMQQEAEEAEEEERAAVKRERERIRKQRYRESQRAARAAAVAAASGGRLPAGVGGRPALGRPPVGGFGRGSRYSGFEHAERGMTFSGDGGPWPESAWEQGW